MHGPGMTTEVAVRTDLDSGALVLTVWPDHTDAEVRSAVGTSAAQHPSAVVLDLAPPTGRWASLLRGLARICRYHAVPLLVVPALVVPTPVAVRSLAVPLALREHPSVAAALASLPSAVVPAVMRRRVHLPATPAAAGSARTAVVETLSRWGLDELLFPAELITSELVSNAVQHAGTASDLLIRLGPAGVRLALRDSNAAAPMPQGSAIDLDRENGRGLYLIARIAARWGWLQGSRDKIVWAEIRPDPADQGVTSDGTAGRGDR